jgi:cytochrome c oxidase subunit 4
MSEAIAHDAGQDSGHGHATPNYIAVFFILFVVTVVEVLVPEYLDLGQGLFLTVMMGMAMLKAALVGLYFMHLKYDHKLLMVIAVVPFILAPIVVGVVAFEGTTAMPPLPMTPTAP